MTAIGEFFAAAEKLRNLGITRSDKYLGDIVVLGPKSVMRRPGLPTPFAIYRIPSDAVRKKKPHKGGIRRLARGDLPPECLIVP